MITSTWRTGSATWMLCLRNCFASTWLNRFRSKFHDAHIIHWPVDRGGIRSEKPKTGPVIAHTNTEATHRQNVSGFPDAVATAVATLLNVLLNAMIRLLIRVTKLPTSLLFTYNGCTRKPFTAIRPFKDVNASTRQAGKIMVNSTVVRAARLKIS